MKIENVPAITSLEKKKLKPIKDGGKARTVAQKIANWFKQTWRKFFYWVRGLFFKTFTLTQRDIRVLESYKDREPPKALRAKKILPTEETKAKQDSTFFPIQKKKPRPKKTFDPALDDMREFAQDFVSTILDEVYKEKVESDLTKFQKAMDAAPKTVKAVAKLIIQMGDHAAKPFVKKLSHNPNPDDPLSIDINEVAPAVHHLLTWLTTDETPSTTQPKKTVVKVSFQVTVRKALKKRLTKMLQDNVLVLGENESLDQYMDPILHWLFVSEHKLPIEDHEKTLQSLQTKSIDVVKEEVLTLLAERKIEHHMNIWDTVINKDLPNIVRKMMKENGAIMTDIITERIAELVSSAPYTQSFDEVMKLAYQQMEAYTVAQKAVAKEQEELIKDRDLVKKSPSGAWAKVEAAKKNLKRVADINKQAPSNPLFKDRYSEKVFFDAFSKQKACHSTVYEMIHPPKGYEQEKYFKCMHKEVVNRVSGHVINLLLGPPIYPGWEQ